MWCPNPECPDVVRYGVAAEYGDGLSICPVCGATLTSARPKAMAWIESDDVACLAIEHVSMLPVIKAELDAAELNYRIVNEGFSALFGAGGGYGNFNVATGPPVLVVAACDLEPARGILNEVEAALAAGPDPAPGPVPKRCRLCGLPMDCGEYDATRAICDECILGWWWA
jgi:ferredoxin